jgi:hypothetical protein
MAKTKKNKNRHSTKKLDVCIVSTKVALIFICLVFCFGGGLIVRHGNNSLTNKIKEAETEYAQLKSILQTERVKLDSKQTIDAIKVALKTHGVNMINARQSQCHLEFLDKNKAPGQKDNQVVAYYN